MPLINMSPNWVRKTQLLMALNTLTEEVTGTVMPNPYSPSEIGVTTSPTGTKGLYSLGLAEALVTNATVPFTLPGDFTLEFFIMPNTLAANCNIFTIGGIDQVNWQSQSMWLETNGKLHWFAFSSPTTGGSQPGTTIMNDGATSNACNFNQWNHVAITRAGNVYSVYINGVRGFTVTSALAPYAPTAQTIFGNYPRSSQSGFKASSPGFPGYFDDIRVTKGVARYTGATYTVPTQPFGKTVATDPYWASVTSFLDMETTNAGVPVDSAGVAWSLVKESPQTIAFNGLSPAQDVACLYLTPATGYLTPKIDLDFGTKDFTVEGWFYSTAYEPNSVSKHLFSTRNHPLDMAGGFSVGIHGSLMYVYTDTTLISTPSGVWQLNKWNHVALTRINGIISLWLNGTTVGNYSARTFNFTLKRIGIGCNSDGTEKLNDIGGQYVSNFRVSNVCRYRTVFTPALKFTLD